MKMATDSHSSDGCRAFATAGAWNFTTIRVEESSFWRDAKTDARNERATRNLPRTISTNEHL